MCVWQGQELGVVEGLRHCRSFPSTGIPTLNHLARTMAFSNINGPSPPASGPLPTLLDLFEKHFRWPARIVI